MIARARYRIVFSQVFGIHDWEWPLLTPAALDAYCRAADKIVEAPPPR